MASSGRPDARVSLGHVGHGMLGRRAAVLEVLAGIPGPVIRLLGPCWALALNWAGLAVGSVVNETRHWFYLVRLLGFLLIIAGVMDKNRGRR